jgi:5'-nucleotidase
MSSVERGLALCAAVLAAATLSAAFEPAATLTISLVGTSDLHGYFMSRAGRGGLELFAGYVNNLRAARLADGGAVLLFDAGDTFQGGVESNLSEGAVVVDAYNALGYTALAIGNHEFDFGPLDRPGARQDPVADPRGALKARAAQARFPFLAANLLDDRTGRRVEWPNVHASTVVSARGVRVGVIGVMTYGALRATLPLNVQGLRMAPLLPTVVDEASRLKASGVQVVVVVAHAGGGCDRFDDPKNLSSCDPNAEIFDLAQNLPDGLVNAIVAGHTHAGLAHEVAGIPIVQSYWGGRAFGRIDLRLDRQTGRPVAATPYPPQDICAESGSAGPCAPAGAPAAARSVYEGRPVVEDRSILEAMAHSLRRVRHLQDTPLGVVLDGTLARTGYPDSPLGNLFADALREQAEADVALNNNGLGGLRADLLDGPVTLGRLYDTFPFDNRIVRVDVPAVTLEQAIANILARGRRGAFGISGARARVSCTAGGLNVQLFRYDGAPIGNTQRLAVVGMDSLLRGAMFTLAVSPVSVEPAADAPTVREVVEDWLRGRGGRLSASEFMTGGRPRLELDDAAPCLAH